MFQFKKSHVMFSGILSLFLTGCSIADPPRSVQKNSPSPVTEKPTGKKGAQESDKSKKTENAMVGAIQPQAVVSTGIDGCDRELKALRKLDARRYALRQAQFTRLMSGASVYAGIRTDVVAGTRESMDAMYRFRTGKLCSEISRDVLDALTRQGDSIMDGHK